MSGVRDNEENKLADSWDPAGLIHAWTSCLKVEARTLENIHGPRGTLLQVDGAQGPKPGTSLYSDLLSIYRAVVRLTNELEPGSAAGLAVNDILAEVLSCSFFKVLQVV